MTQELRLILTLEHLPTHDVTVTGVRHWTFGMVLSVAATEALDASKRDLLRPWLWKLSDAAQTSGLIYRVDVNGVAGQVSATPAAYVTPHFNGCSLDQFATTGTHASAAIDYELRQIPDANDANLKWEPLNGARRVSAPVQSGIATAD